MRLGQRAGWRGRTTPIGRLAGDRRGATALAFAAGALALFGLVTLATEVGTWYMVRSQAQNAADAAVLAGARAAAVTNASGTAAAGSIEAAAIAAAADTAHRDGYTDGAKSGGYSYAVTVHSPPSAGAYTTKSTANEVLIGVGVTPYLASLFTGNSPTLSARAVGHVNTNSNACVLATALSGTALTIGANLYGSSTATASNCAVASNSGDAAAVAIAGTPTVYLQGGITAVGNCSGCGALPVSTANALGLGRQFSAYQPPTINPYTAIDQLGSLANTISASTYSCITAVTPGYLVPGKGLAQDYSNPSTFNAVYPPGGSGSLSPGGPKYAYCNAGTLTINSGVTYVIPGTYYFINSSLDFSGGSGATIQCTTTVDATGVPQPGTCPQGTGVTFILIGDTPGTLTIDSGASFVADASSSSSAYKNFGAPKCLSTGPTPSDCGNDTGQAALNGVLFYGTTSSAVSIAGGFSAYLNGAIYFPNATVSYGNPTLASCTVLVANTINLTPSNSSLNTGCAPYGLRNANMPRLQITQIGE